MCILYGLYPVSDLHIYLNFIGLLYGKVYGEENAGCIHIIFVLHLCRDARRASLQVDDNREILFCQRIGRLVLVLLTEGCLFLIDQKQTVPVPSFPLSAPGINSQANTY